MARASVPTKLPLTTWAKIIGIHPLHFEGITYTPNNRTSKPCDDAFQQFDWQESNRVSREQIAQAIAEAEAQLERWLGFRLIPSWEADEWVPTPRPFRPEVETNFMDIRWRAQPVHAKWGWTISGGVEKRTVNSLGVSIVWTDEDNDNVNETGTVTATLVGNEAGCELEVFYPGKSGDPAYEIRPVKLVSVVSGTATLQFRREQTVILDLTDGLNPEPAVWDQDADFLTTVDIYRHWNDPSQQATLLWEPRGCEFCGSDGCPRCSYAVQTACLILRSSPRVAMLGWSPGTWNADTELFDLAELASPRSPDLVRLWYYAGLRHPTACPRQMTDEWARVVTYLSLCFLDRETCGCSASVWEYWREDFGVRSGGQGTTVYQKNDKLDNPFGSRRGEVYAWQKLQSGDPILPSALAV